MSEKLEKREWRKKMKALRTLRGGDGKAIALRALEVEAVRNGQTFFVYNSFSSEADTSFLIESLLLEGKKVFLPRVEGKDMFAIPYTGKGQRIKNGYGIEEVAGMPYFGKIDVTVMPLLACDEKGNRIGYGGGFYDRFLEGRDTYKLGYCFDYQVAEGIPSEERDQKMDAVVTDKRSIFCQGESK